MKLTSLYKSFFLGTALCLVGCAGEEMVSDIDSVSRAVPITLNVSSGAVTRTVLSEGEDGRMNSVWVEGDVLEVVDAGGNSVGTLALEKGDGSSDAVFSGTINGAVDGATYRLWYLGGSNNGKGPYTTAYQYGNNCYECIWGTSMDYRQSGSEDDLVRAELLTEEVTLTLDGEKAYAKNSVTLKPQLAMAHFTLTNIPDELCDLGNDSQSKLTVSSCDANGSNQLPYRYYIEMNSAKFTGPTIAATYGFQISDVDYVKGNSQAENHADIYLALFPGRYKLTFDLKYGEKEYRYTFQNPTDIKAGMYYCASGGKGISVEMEDVTPEPAGDPEVVGPVYEIDGKKFRFTRANLQYNTKTSMYFIPEKQTDYICKSGRRIGTGTTAIDNPEIIGLFRWGATGVDDNVLLPWPADFWKGRTYDSSNATVSDYLPSQNTSVNRTIYTNPTYCPNGEAQNTAYDWGVAYTNQQKSKLAYFTLTSEQLKGIINTYFAACCTVDGVEGAIILPFTTLESAQDAITAVGGKYNKLYKLSDHYTDRTQFGYDRLTLTYEQLTELDGVFFPASGMNNPNTGTTSKPQTSDYPGNCYYWTSTPSITPNAIVWYVNGGKTESWREFKVYGNGKCFGYSVRLVKEVKE